TVVEGARYLGGLLRADQPDPAVDHHALCVAIRAPRSMPTGAGLCSSGSRQAYLVHDEPEWAWLMRLLRLGFVIEPRYQCSGFLMRVATCPLVRLARMVRHLRFFCPARS